MNGGAGDESKSQSTVQYSTVTTKVHRACDESDTALPSSLYVLHAGLRTYYAVSRASSSTIHTLSRHDLAQMDGNMYLRSTFPPSFPPSSLHPTRLPSTSVRRSPQSKDPSLTRPVRTRVPDSCDRGPPAPE